MALASFLLRLLTCIGDVYYLLLVPLLCLYLAIFVSNKLHSHQQRQQNQQPPQQIAHRRRSDESQHDASAPAASLSSPSSSSSSPSPRVLPADVDTDLSSAHSSVSLTSSSTSSPPSLSSATSPSSSSSTASSSTSLSLTFLLPDQSLVRHTFPATTTSISAVIATLYPPPSTLTTSARLIYQGRLLHPTSLLAHHAMAADDVVHVHLLHAGRDAVGEGGGGGGVGVVGVEPPGGLVCVLAVMCAGVGCGWGVFVVCGAVLFDLASLCILLCATGLTAVGILYAHACTLGQQRPAVVPL